MQKATRTTRARAALRIRSAKSRRRDLNPRPTHYECVALPTELQRQTPRPPGQLLQGWRKLPLPLTAGPHIAPHREDAKYCRARFSLQVEPGRFDLNLSDCGRPGRGECRFFVLLRPVRAVFLPRDSIARAAARATRQVTGGTSCLRPHQPRNQRLATPAHAGQGDESGGLG